MIGNHNEGILRVIPSKITTDSSKHNNHKIKRYKISGCHNSNLSIRVCLATDIKKIFTLDSLAGNISMYNLNCVLERKIAPKSFYQKKDVMVLDFAWSDKQQRVTKINLFKKLVRLEPVSKILLLAFGMLRIILNLKGLYPYQKI